MHNNGWGCGGPVPAAAAVVPPLTTSGTLPLLPGSESQVGRGASWFGQSSPAQCEHQPQPTIAHCAAGKPVQTVCARSPCAAWLCGWLPGCAT